MTGPGPRRARLTVAVAVASACTVLVMSGCDQRAATRDDLSQVLTGVHSAVGASLVALDLYADGRTTRAAAETTLSDMSEEVGRAPGRAEKIAIHTDQDETERDASAVAVTAASAALLGARDDLQRTGGTGPGRSALVAADRLVVDTQKRLQAPP